MNNRSLVARNVESALALTGAEEFVTMTIMGQLFGIPVLKVQDVLGPQKVTPIPLAPREVAGSLNLRGRIVTAVDVRKRLGLPPRDRNDRGMMVVVDHMGELYSLVIDQVGEVLSVSGNKFERNPPTLDQRLREYSQGIYRLNEKLLVVLDVDKMLDFSKT